jgi:hypothetical protein
VPQSGRIRQLADRDHRAQGHDADAFRREATRAHDLSLGTGLGRLAGKIFRIGHLGFFNDLTLCGTLCGVEMALAASRVPHKSGGIAAALSGSPARRAPNPAQQRSPPARPDSPHRTSKQSKNN